MSNLYDPYKGGISSYTLILMLVAYFQCLENSAEKSQLLTIDNLGYLLVDFLHVFKQYSFKYLKVAPVHPDIENLGEQVNTIQFQTEFNSILWVTDPLDAFNNVAKASFNFTAFE